MCGLWSLNDLYVNQFYLIGTIGAKRKGLSISAPILHSPMEAEHLSDWSKVTHGAGDKQDARLADLQSRVLSLHLVKQKRLSHEGIR